MYTDVKTILDDASKNNYGVLAAAAINLELARGLIAAADELQAPLIILMGQIQMTKHARADVMVPLIKTLAEETNVPVALILDLHYVSTSIILLEFLSMHFHFLKN